MAADNMNGGHRASQAPTVTACRGSTIVLSPKGSWRWVSGNRLEVPVTRADAPLRIDGKSVLLAKDIVEAVTSHVPKSAQYLHCPAACTPGAIASVWVDVDTDTLSGHLRCTGRPIATAETKGTFRICPSPLQPSEIPGSPPARDTKPEHRGTWRMGAAGQATCAEEARAEEALAETNLCEAADEEPKCADTPRWPREQSEAHADRCYLLFMGWSPNWDPFSAGGHAAVAWQHVGRDGVACPPKSIGIYPKRKGWPYSVESRIVCADHVTFVADARRGRRGLALFVAKVDLPGYNRAVRRIEEVMGQQLPEGGGECTEERDGMAAARDFWLGSKSVDTPGIQCANFVESIALAAGLRTVAPDVQPAATSSRPWNSMAPLDSPMSPDVQPAATSSRPWNSMAPLDSPMPPDVQPDLSTHDGFPREGSDIQPPLLDLLPIDFIKQLAHLNLDGGGGRLFSETDSRKVGWAFPLVPDVLRAHWR